jgi:Transposase
MACPTDPRVGTYGATIACLSPLPPFKTGWRPGEKKAQDHIQGAFLEWALEAFSGYAAVDELYEGPYCVLSAVDNRQYKRVMYEVLDHDANHDDIEAFLGRLKTALDERNLLLKGITTDGSPLYPEPIRKVFGDVPHQLCTFHVIKDLTKGILKAVAKERERLAQTKPKLKRGRPSSKDKEARRLARKSKNTQQKISDLFQDRFLFVKRRLKPSERKRLLYITRGLPHLRKLRDIIDSIYTLFDRRCHTQTALSKLKKLRHWVKRFKWIGDTLKKVFSPNLEKALIVLDDKLLPATSNAVERGNRRHRKMQKSVYRVRNQSCLEGRIALDMMRESRAEGRGQTTETLHRARRGCT